MTTIKREQTGSPTPPTKSGEYYDRCVTDGCIEVDRSFKHGGTDGKGQEHLNWAMYHADPRKGGCGTSWSRTTRQGVERDQARGVNSKWKTGTALADRFTLTSSEMYRDGYNCAFQKCCCPYCGPSWLAGEPARCEPGHHGDADARGASCVA